MDSSIILNVNWLKMQFQEAHLNITVFVDLNPISHVPIHFTFHVLYSDPVQSLLMTTV